MTSRPIRIVLLGLGAINTRLVELFSSHKSNIAVVGVVMRRGEFPNLPALAKARRIADGAQLAALSPDLILEAASPAAVREWGEIALGAAKRVVLSSTSVLVDDDLRNNLIAAARRRSSYLVLSPGALAGIDALSAAGRLKLDAVCHRILKPPKNWSATAGQSALSDLHQRTVLFAGSAREAARNYPQNANVTVVTALAGIGLDKTRVELVSDPLISGNRHEIQARGDFGSVDIAIENRPLLSNPKSSELAALALLRLTENETPGVVL